MMKRAKTTLRLTLAALSTVALFGAAAAAGIDRSTEMMDTGISPDRMQTGHIQTGGALSDDYTMIEAPVRAD